MGYFRTVSGKKVTGEPCSLSGLPGGIQDVFITYQSVTKKAVTVDTTEVVIEKGG